MFQLAVEEGVLTDVNRDLKLCAYAFKSEPEYLKILSSPVVSVREKQTMLQAVFRDRCHELVYNFLCLLAEKGRISLFEEIQKDFVERYNRSQNLLDVEVTTCVPLTEELRQKLIQKLQRQTGKNVSVTEKVDESILGGVVVKYDNTVIDGSVKNRFNELSKRLHRL
jgi:F-type H+-transporting ATPase subunit delta